MDRTERSILQDIRKEIFLTAVRGGIGHLASAFSLVEILYTLYERKVLAYRPGEPQWKDRERLILSKGHGSLALYVMLQRAGYFDVDYLHGFCQPGSTLGGEGNPISVPGIEAATGSLGMGIGYGLGIALADKLNRNPKRTYVILGDGECQEGAVWEAAIVAAAHRLDNLVAILDCNGVQKMATTENTMGKVAWEDKWSAFGWDVNQVEGHDIDRIETCLRSLGNRGKPHLVLARTVKGKGVSIMENSPSWHWRMPTRRELEIVLKDLCITKEEYDKCSKHI